MAPITANDRLSTAKFEIRESKAVEWLEDHDKFEPIAVIGLSFGFPQDVISSTAFWEMMMKKRGSFTEVPKERFSSTAMYHQDANRKGQIAVRGAHFLTEDIAAFDAEFFSTSPGDAAAMDPQQRALLEYTYKALENAGLPLETVSGTKTSVYTGCFTNDWQHISFKDSEQCDTTTALGIQPCVNANRLSWFYNFTGNSANIDTACSSSLVALDLGCKGLLCGDTEMSVVAGCNLIFSPDTMHALTNMNMLSADGECYSFDHRANGYARGEGFGVLILKRLSDAIRDRDTIRALIRNTGCNQDGYTPGITQPNSLAQEELIRETYATAGLSMKPTKFFEAHGTGTPVGDPLESTAIGAAFRKTRTSDDPLYVGAVKSNIGHLEGASGIAGVIKAILVLEKGIIPPNTNFEKPNPKIDTEFLRIKFPLQPTPWPTTGLRRVSVNSFGFGGTNAHAVLDDAFHYLNNHGLIGRHITVKDPPSQSSLLVESNGLEEKINGTADGLSAQSKSGPTLQLLMFSANDENGIKRQIDAFVSHLSESGIPSGKFEDYLHDLAYTLDKRRTSLPWKSFSTVASLDDLKALNTTISDPVKSILGPTLGFVFTGQGAQWAGMGQELLVYDVFARSLADAEQYLAELGSPWLLREELFKSAKLSNINRPDFSQPLCTAVQIGLVDLLRSLGVHPTAVVGHSSGEIAAAYTLGAISAKAAWKIAYYRGACAAHLLTGTELQGAMISVGLSSDEVFPHLESLAVEFGGKGLNVACINSHKNVTVAGDSVQVDALKNVLDQQKVFARKLMVDVAYHSRHMELVAGKYLNLLGHIERGTTPRQPATMISSVTGERVETNDLSTPGYWVSNMVSPVRFSEAINQICARSASRIRKKLDLSHRNHFHINMLVEIGPHPALQGPIRDILTKLPGGGNITYCTILARKQSAMQSFINAIGRLKCLGYSIDLGKISPNSEGYDGCMALPNLPEYPFDHSKSYWYESRLSKRFRTHSQSKLDLLGKPVPDWNPLEAKWRNVLRVSEMPWMEDHVINGSLVYPAAGMLVMAIEAANQMADPTQKTIGFELKDTSFLRSLTIPQDTAGIETQLSLHLLEETFTTSNSWAEFRLCAFENSQWHECCRGSIRVEYQAVSNNFDGGQEKSEELRMGVDIDSSISTACQSRMDPVALYKSLNNNGFGFGPAFQPISNASFGADNESHANIRLFEWPPKQFPQPHIVHPTSLDGMLHLAIAGYAKGGELPVPTMIPTLLRSLWISKHGLNNSENSSVRASAWMIAEDNRGTEFDASILNPEKTAILAQIRGLRLTIIADANTEALEPQTRQVCYHIDSLPDPDLLTSGQDLNHSRVDEGQQLEKSKLQEATLSLALSFLRRALNENIKMPTQTLTPQLEAYTQWASAHLESSSGSQGDALASSPQLGVIDEPTFKSLCHFVEGSGVEGQHFVAIGRNLPRILRGEIDILGILDQLRAPVDFGGQAPSETAYHDDFTTYSNLLGHKNPNLRILEVSSGPNEMIYRFMEGNATKNPQDQQHNFRYGTYHYTNISQLYIDQVRENLAQYPRLTIGTLDLEGDLQSQGYEAGNYDIIFATNIFSRTQDPGRALRNASRLLSPGGRLVANEPRLPTSLQSGFITGLVSSWWMDTKDWTETDSMKQWQQLFTNNGFMPFDLEIPDHLAGFGQQSFLVARASTTSVKTRREQSLVFIRDPSSSIQNDLSEGLKERFKSIPSVECSSTDMSEHATLPNISQTIFVVLLELDRPFLYNLSEGEYHVLKQFLMSSKDIVWINPYGGSAIDKPEFALAGGLARALRNEYEEHRFTTLALDFHDTISEKQVEQVYDIILRNHVYENTSDWEPEYIEIDGRLNIQRLVHVPQLDTEIYTRSLPQKSTTIAIADAPPIYLIIGSPGLLDTLHFVEDKIYYEPLGDDEVEIQTQAVGMNFKDCLIALGQVPGNTFGLECSGIVTRAGKDTGLVPGERLVMAAPGSFRTFTRGKAAASCKIPDEMSFIEAASIPAQFGTAWEVLHEMARIRKGETVLIHAAAGGTGQAAIQIAQFLGAIVFATVGSQEKKKLLNQEYGIPEDHIFYSRDTSFAKGIKRVTKGRGVDVIINSLAGESLRASWDCIASYGRFVEIGKKDVVSNANLPMLSFGKNASFIGFDASIWQKERPMEANRDLKIIVDLFANKTFHTAKPLHVHNISNIEGVFRIMQDGKSSGKIVLEITPSSQISATLDTKPGFMMDPNATYVIAGGLGGLGRSIARWMVDRNAKNLVLLSRFGPRLEVAKLFVNELEVRGVRVWTPPCDVSDERAMTKVFTELSDIAPPIKGCIQASMVRRDELFENMGFDSWRTAVECKTLGSWNLHSLLPKGMDFFILLSSAAGLVGLRGQTNYAAGNVYEDALARYRVSHGEKAVALDLGAMIDDGLLAENPELLNRVLAYGTLNPVSRQQFFAILDYYCDPKLPILTSRESQAVIGLGSGGGPGLDGVNLDKQPLFRHLLQVNQAQELGEGEGKDDVVHFKQLLADSGSLITAGNIVVQALIQKLSKSLSTMQGKDIDIHKPLHAYGVDSLLAVELRNWISKEFLADVAVFETLGSSTFSTLGMLVAGRSVIKHPGWVI